ncbi:poly(A) polymerase type 3-like [Enoplosus armatus]|uniref:poly(A) polymerase type 3-like n=1 Tax=Enoplosus armatus TaxID=215367 RepID=UPI003991C3E4
MGPEEADLLQTRELIETLKPFGAFEKDMELRHREKVVKMLESLYKEWLTETCEMMNLPETVTANVGGKIFPFGSYQMGVHSKGADIDALCVGPGFLDRKDFFTSSFDKLKAQEEVQEIGAIEDAFVPVIKLSFNGIEIIWLEKKIDLVFARIAQRSIPDTLDLLDDKILKNLSKRCVRTLVDYRVTEEILSIHNFRLALRAVKLWAKREELPISTLLKWRVEDRYFNLPVWDRRINPAYPQQNTVFNVYPPTLAVTMEEIQWGM